MPVRTHVILYIRRPVRFPGAPRAAHVRRRARIHARKKSDDGIIAGATVVAGLAGGKLITFRPLPLEEHAPRRDVIARSRRGGTTTKAAPRVLAKEYRLALFLDPHATPAYTAPTPSSRLGAYFVRRLNFGRSWRIRTADQR